MAWRFDRDKVNPSLIPYMPSASTGGNISSSDRGKLVTVSSNKVGLLQGSSLAPVGAIIAGIFSGVLRDNLTNTSADSTNRVYIEPIQPNEILEVDYSTAYAASTATLMVTSNIGYYFNTCTTEGLAGGGSSVIQAGILAGLFDPTDGVAVADTSHWIRLVGFDNTRRIAKVTIPSSNLA